MPKYLSPAYISKWPLLAANGSPPTVLLCLKAAIGNDPQHRLESDVPILPIRSSVRKYKPADGTSALPFNAAFDWQISP